MARRNAPDPHQQTMCLIWESELVRAGNNQVMVVAKKPLSTMTAKQAAKVLGVSTWTISKLRKAGRIHGAKPGAVAKRRDGRASNASLVLDTESVLRYKEEAKREA